MRDDLLQPSLEGVRPRAQDAPGPWALSSQFFVAFFGGSLGVGVIAALNARRLGLPRRVEGLIAAAAIAGLAGVVALAAALDDVPTYGLRAVALAAWGGMWLLQREADRRWVFNSREEEPYASLWWPGLLAVILGAAVQFILVQAITGEAG